MGRWSFLVLVAACGGQIAPDDHDGDAGAADAIAETSSGGEACASATLHVDVVSSAALPSITVAGSAGVAFSDPSFLDDPGPATYLTYTAIDADGGRWLEGASTLDGGTSFTHGGSAYGGSQFPCDAGTCALVIGPASSANDPGAQIGANVKTFTQIHLSDPSASPLQQLAQGYIAKSDDYGFQFGSASPWLRWNDEAVAQGAPIDLRALPQLSACTSFGEPSAIARANSVDLALTCRTAKGTSVVLLRSTDHAKSVGFVSTLLYESDASALGGTTADVLSPELFEANGQSYLIVSTASGIVASLPSPDACVTVELASDDAVARDCAGHPIVTRRIVEAQHLPFGSCSYARGGYFASVYDVSASPPYRIVATGITAP